MPRGTVGTPIDLVANFYKFDFADHVISHYDVCITKDEQGTNGVLGVLCSEVEHSDFG